MRVCFFCGSSKVLVKAGPPKQPMIAAGQWKSLGSPTSCEFASLISSELELSAIKPFRGSRTRDLLRDKMSDTSQPPLLDNMRVIREVYAVLIQVVLS